MARALHWIRRVIYCCLCLSGVVYGLRSQTRVRAVCLVPDHRRDLGADIRLAACGLVNAVPELAIATLNCAWDLFAAAEVNFASGKAFKREAKSALGAIYAIVGRAGSWHNHLA